MEPVQLPEPSCEELAFHKDGPSMTTADQVFVGIDVSEAQLEVHMLPSEEHFVVENSDQGFEQLLGRLKQAPVELVVMEATGAVEHAAARAIGEAGLELVVANPRRTRHFARAMGLLAKTDRIDATGLAHYAEKVRPEPTRLSSPARQALKDAIQRRRQLVKMRTAEKNRLRRVAARPVRRSIEQLVRCLDKQIDKFERQLEKLVAEDPRTRRLHQIITSVPGLGTQSACAVIAELPELGQANRQQIAALAGVAPYNCDSGTLRGQRRIYGGRATLRQALYMAMLAATRYNPVIRSFYRRLIQAGKPAKLALTAAMRKTLVILNAMVRKDQTWQPETP